MDENQAAEGIEKSPGGSLSSEMRQCYVKPTVLPVVENEGENDENWGEAERYGGQGEEESPGFELVFGHEVSSGKTYYEGEDGAGSRLEETES
jgi:hypothetical protein